ncbi:MAG: hypothetical protein LBH17_02765 [Oscillospiraceae bacterium]|nr:hypothetical protein [Oscillospiraceae bacterium]
MTISVGDGRIVSNGGVYRLFFVGRINTKLFKEIMTVLTDEVILTEKQIEHIKERHPRDYERYAAHIPEILSTPDYILEANKPNSLVLLKKFSSDDGRFQLILRLKSSADDVGFSNSVITFMKIEEKRYLRYLRAKKILYKRE